MAMTVPVRPVPVLYLKKCTLIYHSDTQSTLKKI